MKIAFGLHGIVGGVDGKYGEGDSKEALEKGYEHYKKYILDHNDCDVFCHTSTMERKSEILDLYKPVKSKFTEQPNFEIPKKHHAGRKGNRIQGHYHKWWSHKIVSELRQEYEKETGVKYDMVYIGRYDLAWNTIVDFSKFDPNKFWLGHWNRIPGVGNREWYTRRNIDNLPLIKNNKYVKALAHLFPKSTEDIPLVGYPHNKEGVIDQWAFSSPKLMDIYCKLYDNLDKYITREPNTWWDGESTIHDHMGSISNHRLIPCHLESEGILDKLEFAFYFHDDFPTVRRLYYGT